MATSKTGIKDDASSPQTCTCHGQTAQANEPIGHRKDCPSFRATAQITNDIVIQKPYNNVTEPSDEEAKSKSEGLQPKDGQGWLSMSNPSEKPLIGVLIGSPNLLAKSTKPEDKWCQKDKCEECENGGGHNYPEAKPARSEEFEKYMDNLLIDKKTTTILQGFLREVYSKYLATHSEQAQPTNLKIAIDSIVQNEANTALFAEGSKMAMRIADLEKQLKEQKEAQPLQLTENDIAHLNPRGHGHKPISCVACKNAYEKLKSMKAQPVKVNKK